MPLSDRASELAGNFSPAITNQAWRRRLFLIAIGGIFFEIAYLDKGVNVSVHLLLGILFKYPPETSPCPSWG